MTSSPTQSVGSDIPNVVVAAQERAVVAPRVLTAQNVLLAGNPNCGKTTLFNALTGARQRVGNYPGVTVEKRVGRATLDDVSIDLMDLPGTYSLSSYSPEERIAQRELLRGEGEVVVLVADATNLKRGLVLLAQLLQLHKRLVLCLNMADEAEQAGQVLDVKRLEEILGLPVVSTVGHRGIGIDALRTAIRRAAQAPPVPPRRFTDEYLRGAKDRIVSALESLELPPSQWLWLADRLLVGDEETLKRLSSFGEAGAAVLRVAEGERAALEAATGMDAPLCVTNGYFGFVDGLLAEALRRRPREDARALSDRIDAVVAHRVLGLPIFLGVMYGVFWLTFTVGETPMGWIEAGFEWLGGSITALWPAASSSPLKSLIVDGAIGGVGGVLVFLPNIVLLFFGLAILEDSGYMARAAFIVDRVMHRFGLHGRSFVPMMTGFGCSIPGIMATRTMENERDRLTTMFVVPLMSCGARLPIWMLLVPAFFAPPWRAPALWGIYILGVVLALLLALLLRRTVFRGEESPFVMELPPYRMPTLRSVLSKMWDRSWMYLRKAGTVILGISILMWVITAYPKASEYAIDRAIHEGTVVVVDGTGDGAAQAAQANGTTAEPTVMTPNAVEAARASEDIRSSVAGRVGTLIEPLLKPLGLDWKVGVGLVGAFAAKEVFVAQMGIVHALGEADQESLPLRTALARDYSPIAGFALMIFLLVGTPCMATVAVMRRESGSWRWAWLQFGGLTLLAYVLALAFYQTASVLG